MKQETFTRVVKYGALSLAALVISPIIFAIVKGVVGLALAAVVLLVLNALAPAFSVWLGQLKYGAMRGVISRAPVDALVQRLDERWKAIKEASTALQEQAAELQRFKAKVAQYVHDWPEEAEAMKAKLDTYEKLFALRLDMFKKAKQNTQEFARKVDKAEAVYDMALADKKLAKSFNKTEDFDAYFREKVAFEAIDRESATSLASLQMALVDEQLDKKVDAPVHAINYNANNEVVTGNILNVPQEVPR